MSIHLVGGGWSDEVAPELFGGFLDEAAVRAAGSGRMVPRIGLVLFGTDEESAEYHELYPEAMRLAGRAFDLQITRIDEHDPAPSSALTDIDALFVGGGPTPLYHSVLEPLYDEIRLLVADGLPYLGFSAGAMIAAERAVIGGFRIDDIVVCPEDAGEDLDEVTIVPGLGLVDLAIDVHAAQWGTLSRLIASVEAGLVPGGVAIDESTVLVVGDGLRVAGAGNVWQVVDGPDGVLVGTLVN